MKVNSYEKQEAQRLFDAVTKNTFIFGKGIISIGGYDFSSFENFVKCIEAKKEPLSEEEKIIVDKLGIRRISPFDEIRERISLMVLIFKGIVKTGPLVLEEKEEKILI